MKHVSLDVSGMTCAACASRIEKVLNRTQGVEHARVNLAMERAQVEIDDGFDANDLIAAIERSGYGAALRGDDPAELGRQDALRMAEKKQAQRKLLIRFTLSALLTLPLVFDMISMLVGSSRFAVSPMVQAVLAGGVILISGTRFYREAYLALRGGSANMAVLVSLGTSVAYIYSLAELLMGNQHDHLYFEAAAVVLTLVMLGKFLEERAKGGATAALHALSRLQPREAELIVGTSTRTVPAETLAKGDHVRVQPGTSFPCDGVILSGSSAVDESLVTGESIPVEKHAGDGVITGTINGSGSLDIAVSATGSDTRLARMARLIEEAQVGQAPIQRLVDRISAIFVPAIIVLALITFAAWWLISGDLSQAISATVAVLVIACPCALGLATPTALVAGTGAAAKAGILIRNIETLENADGIETVAFDKTGTLTIGKPTLTALIAVDGDETTLLEKAAAVESRSEHPLAKALVIHAEERGIPVPHEAAQVKAIIGQGAAGIFRSKKIAVGNYKLAKAEGVEDHALLTLRDTIGSGTIAYVIEDGVLIGAVSFADQARPEAKEAISLLQQRGLHCLMLTGDTENIATEIGTELGITDIHASLSPEEKLMLISDMANKTAFVGDGLNDGPALAAARLGIAMSSGADVAREAAGITLMRPDLRLVPAALDIAARTRRTIWQNLGWAFIYNVIGIPLAAFGMLSPVLAGAAMAFSSVSVVLNALRLARWKPARFET